MTKLIILEAKAVDDMQLMDLLVGRSIAEVERDLILRTLESCGGNRTHAARTLGITVRTLRNKLARFRGEAEESESE